MSVTTERIAGLREEITQELNYVNPNSAPLILNLIKLGRVKKIGSTKVSWVDYEAKCTRTSITSTVNNSTTSVPVENAEVFKNGVLVRIADEVMKVTSISDKTLTVERGQQSTAAVQHETGAEIIIINDGIAEGADFVENAYKAGVNYDNVTQIVREDIAVSGTATAINLPSSNGVDAYELEKTKAIDLVLAKGERAAVSGIKFESGNQRGMNGIKEYLKKGQNIDAGAADITYDMLNELARMVNATGGNLTDNGYAFYVSGVQAVKISKLLKEYIKATPETTVLGAVTNLIATPFGIIPIIISNNLDAGEILLLNHNNLELGMLRELEHMYMGQQGDSTKGIVLMELTLEARGIHQQGRIFNLKK